MSNLSRRDFLKVGAATLAGALLSSAPRSGPGSTLPAKQKPNIIVILFDAMSARNLSVYGYPRQTTPNFERFVERASVYHSHYSGGNFTTPATASMLTGLYPWRHRAINFHGLVRRELENQNLFSLLGSDYLRLGYTQNPLAQTLLGQFRAHIDRLLPLSSFSFRQRLPDGEFFSNDPLSSGFAYGEFLGPQARGVKSGSLLVDFVDHATSAIYNRFGLSQEYPLGLPNNRVYDYKLEHTFAGIRENLAALARSTTNPYFAYFHLWSPHEPSAPHRDFIGKFDNQSPAVPRRPSHPYSNNNYSEKESILARKNYDEYIANVDNEFGRLMERLEQDGILDNTWLIVTADHGQLFERGTVGHATKLLFDPVIHIPLLIRAPGQSARQDVYLPTSNTDILPTILALAERQIPTDLEGQLLPGLGGAEEPGRPIVSMEALQSRAFASLENATLSMRKGDWKLIRYFGYAGNPELYELYHLREDPFEMNEQSQQTPRVAKQMKAELLTLLDEANRPFQRT